MSDGPAKRLPPREVGVAAAGVVVLLGLLTSVAGWVNWSAVVSWLAARAVSGMALLVGTGLVAAAVWSLSRGQKPLKRERPRSALNWWVIAGALVVVVIVSWATTAWLLGEAALAKDVAAARVEAIKTGLGVGAGTGGVFALLLAVRRQWHQELTAVDTTLDATERRVTELYAKAVEQLGSDKAAVRLGGLYALERLAQANPAQRQTVVNVLCAYLRMPYQAPTVSAPTSQSAEASVDRGGLPPTDESSSTQPVDLAAEWERRTQEREVRLAAQSIITSHLRRGTEPEQVSLTFWPDIDLDLTGAALIDLEMSYCHVRSGQFMKATFIGDAWLAGMHFSEYASFADASFTGHAWFGHTIFCASTSFAKASITGRAAFDFASFEAEMVRFNGMTCGGNASFANASFAGKATFNDTSFAGSVSFRSSVFGGAATFNFASFAGDVEFESVNIAGRGVFSFARFARNPGFTSARFNGLAELPDLVNARFRIGAEPKDLPLGLRLVADDDEVGWQVVVRDPAEESGAV